MKGRKHRETGGANEAEEDVKDKPEPRTDAKKIDAEAEEMKKGGRAKRKRGGRTGFGPENQKVEGEKSAMHAGRKPRKSGGKASSDANPFTSARSGTDGPGRKVMKGELGFGED
jgi:hypothetical protein